jgi:hypothetical protein
MSQLVDTLMVSRAAGAPASVERTITSPVSSMKRRAALVLLLDEQYPTQA